LAANTVSEANLAALATNSSLQHLNLTLTNISEKGLNKFAKRKDPTMHTLLLGRCQLLTNKSIINLLRFQPIETIELWEVSRLTDELLAFIETHELALRQIGLERCDHITEEAAGKLARSKPHIRITVNKSSQVINELQRNLELRSKAREEKGTEVPTTSTPNSSPSLNVYPPRGPMFGAFSLKPPPLAAVKLRKVDSPVKKV
jgi:hypothetical protein